MKNEQLKINDAIKYYAIIKHNIQYKKIVLNRRNISLLLNMKSFNASIEKKLQTLKKLNMIYLQNIFHGRRCTEVILQLQHNEELEKQYDNIINDDKYKITTKFIYNIYNENNDLIEDDLKIDKINMIRCNNIKKLLYNGPITTSVNKLSYKLGYSCYNFNVKNSLNYMKDKKIINIKYEINGKLTLSLNNEYEQNDNINKKSDNVIKNDNIVKYEKNNIKTIKTNNEINNEEIFDIDNGFKQIKQYMFNLNNKYNVLKLKNKQLERENELLKDREKKWKINYNNLKLYTNHH